MSTRFFLPCLTLVALTTLADACCKGYCADDSIFGIDFLGFAPSDMQKVKILSYSKDNLVSAIDSYYVSSNNIIVRDTTRVYLDHPLQIDSNFRISLENAGLTYTITNLTSEKKDCNCGSGTYEKLSGYDLNGVPYTGRDKVKPEIRK